MLFLGLRGTEQSGLAFRNVDKQIEKLVNNEAKWANVSKDVARKQMQLQAEAIRRLDVYNRALFRLMFAGAALLGFAVAVGYMLGRVVGKADEAQLLMRDFEYVLNKLKIEIVNSILKYWGPQLKLLVDLMDSLAENKMFLQLTGYLLVPLVMIFGFMGVTVFANALFNLVFNTLISKLIEYGYINPLSERWSVVGNKIRIVVFISLLALMFYVLWTIIHGDEGKPKTDKDIIEETMNKETDKMEKQTNLDVEWEFGKKKTGIEILPTSAIPKGFSDASIESFFESHGFSSAEIEEGVSGVIESSTSALEGENLQIKYIYESEVGVSEVETIIINNYCGDINNKDDLTIVVNNIMDDLEERLKQDGYV